MIDQPILPRELIERAIKGMDMIRHGEYDTAHPPYDSPWKPGDDKNTLCKIEMPQIANAAIRELISHPALGQIAAEVTGAEMVQVWWTQLLYKPPTAKVPADTVVGWHQDRAYWDTCWRDAAGLFTAWIALSDVTEDAGPVKFVPGSHRWGTLPGDFYGQDNDKLKADIATPQDEQWREVAGVLPAGGVSFHDSLTLHGSNPNHSTGPRRSLAIHLCTQQAQLLPTKDNETHLLAQFLRTPAYSPTIYDQTIRGR